MAGCFKREKAWHMPVTDMGMAFPQQKRREEKRKMSSSGRRK